MTVADVRRNIGLDRDQPGRAHAAAGRDFRSVAACADRQRGKVMDMRCGGPAQLRRRELPLVVQRARIAFQQSQRGAVGDNGLEQGAVQIADMQREQGPAQAQIDHACRCVAGERRRLAIGSQGNLTFADLGSATVLFQRGKSALHGDEHDIVIVDQVRRMTVAHRRKRSRCHAESGKGAQLQLGLQPAALQRLHIDPQDRPAENFPERFDTIGGGKRIGRQAQRRQFIRS